MTIKDEASLTTLRQAHAEVYVRAAFRLILAREPDAGGLSNHVAALFAGGRPDSITQSLADSAERASLSHGGTEFWQILAVDEASTHAQNIFYRLRMMGLDCAGELG